MKKILMFMLMAVCSITTASASNVSYEPPKVGIEMPDIGYSTPMVDVVEVVACGSEMVQIAVSTSQVVSLARVIGLKSNSINVPKPITKRVDNKFIQHIRNIACCSALNAQTILNRIHNKV